MKGTDFPTLRIMRREEFAAAPVHARAAAVLAAAAAAAAPVHARAAAVLAAARLTT